MLLFSEYPDNPIISQINTLLLPYFISYYSSTFTTRRCGSVYLGVVVLNVREVCYVYEGYVGSAMVLYIEGLVEMCEVVGVELYWKLITKMMGVVCEVISGFLHGVVFIGCW